jgi:hypothetical protein
MMETIKTNNVDERTRISCLGALTIRAVRGMAHT